MPDGTNYLCGALLSDDNAKLNKSNESGEAFYTVGLSLAPANTSGFNVCAKATNGCKAVCLYGQGRGRFADVARGRVARTRLFFENREAFKVQLFAELHKAQRKADKMGVTLAVRLNVLSDLPWERIFPDLFTTFPRVQFYDYTKVPNRVVPSNYHLTFSRSETNELDALWQLKAGRNVAVVFRSKDIPATWHGYDVVNGDVTDLRFLDRSGVVVGLYAKGTAKADASGFVTENWS